MLGTLTIMAVASFQASPADADISCIIGRVPAAARIAIVNEAMTGQRGEMRQSFDTAASACMRERSWPMSYATRVWRVALATAVAGEAANRLERSGISPAIVRAWRDAQTADMRNGVDRQWDRSRALYAHLLASGVPQALLDSNAVVVGMFIEALRTIEIGGNEGP